MFIKLSELLPVAILGMSVVAASTDVFRGRIYNWLTLPAIILGIAACSLDAGLAGALHASLGVLAALLIYGWMFALGWMGGGDVKFLMALGAWGGPVYAMHVGVLGIGLGGIFAILYLAAGGSLRDFIGRIYYSLLTLFIKNLSFEPPRLDGTKTMPFGVPMACAAAWALLGGPLLGSGGVPW